MCFYKNDLGNLQLFSTEMKILSQFLFLIWLAIKSKCQGNCGDKRMTFTIKTDEASGVVR